MNLDAELVNSTLRLEVLQTSGPVCQARVESVAGRRITVVSDAPLTIDAAVQLDTPGGIFLAEVVALERTPGGTLALLDIQHSLAKADIQQVLSCLRAPASRATAAGA